MLHDFVINVCNMRGHGVRCHEHFCGMLSFYSSVLPFVEHASNILMIILQLFYYNIFYSLECCNNKLVGCYVDQHDFVEHIYGTDNHNLFIYP